MKLASLVAAVLVFAASDASADETDDTRPVLAIAAGAGLMFGSAAAGLTVEAADRHRDGKNAAIALAQTGMFLAPIAAHGVVGEWTRGLWFSIPGAASVLGTLALLPSYPDIVKRAPPLAQYALSATLLISMFGSGIGVLDAAFAPSRQARKVPPTQSSSLWLAPTFGGAMLMGTL